MARDLRTWTRRGLSQRTVDIDLSFDHDVSQWHQCFRRTPGTGCTSRHCRFLCHVSRHPRNDLRRLRISDDFSQTIRVRETQLDNVFTRKAIPRVCVSASVQWVTTSLSLPLYWNGRWSFVVTCLTSTWPRKRFLLISNASSWRISWRRQCWSPSAPCWARPIQHNWLSWPSSKSYFNLPTNFSAFDASAPMTSVNRCSFMSLVGAKITLEQYHDSFPRCLFRIGCCFHALRQPSDQWWSRTEREIRLPFGSVRDGRHIVSLLLLAFVQCWRGCFGWCSSSSGGEHLHQYLCQCSADLHLLMSVEQGEKIGYGSHSECHLSWGCR